MIRCTASLALLVLALLFAAPSTASTPTILVDGVVIRTDVPPVVEDGHVLVPLRGIFERFSAAVDYDTRSSIATARRNGVTVRVAVGTDDAWIDGQHVALETPAREIAGRVEVPLRFVAQALGITVDFDASTDTIVVVSGGGASEAVPAAAPVIASQAEPAQSYAATPTVAAPSVTDERPAEGTLVGSQYPQIYANFSGSTGVDPSSVRVVVDGIDVTASSTVSSQYIAYTPADALVGGSHSVEVSGADEAGRQFDARWSFRVDDGMTTEYVTRVIGYGPGAFGYHRYGFYPPGFSVFAPGPQFFYANQPIIIVFFSPFFPYGAGFFTVSGIPGQFAMTPWLGCPGFWWSTFSVPGGVFDPEAVVGARFTTADGRTVVVHSTAPLRLDGTRRSAPPGLRYAVRASLVGRPLTPNAMVAFRRSAVFDRLGEIARRPLPVRAGSSRKIGYAERPIESTFRPIARQLHPISPVMLPRISDAPAVVRLPPEPMIKFEPAMPVVQLPKVKPPE